MNPKRSSQDLISLNLTARFNKMIHPALTLTLTLTTLVFATSAAYGDPLSDRLKALGFIEAKPPKPGTDEWYKINHTEAYIVELKDALHVRAAKEDELYTPKVVFEAGPVKYIGIDKGEFGGGLYLDKINANEKPFFPGNIKGLVPIENDLYIIKGLAHGTSNSGAVYVIRNYKEPSRPERITLLPSAPETILIDTIFDRKSIVIVGHDSFMILESDDRLHVIHHDTFWGSLYPSSIVKFNEFYVFGIRGGVVATEADLLWRRNSFRYFKLRN